MTEAQLQSESPELPPQKQGRILVAEDDDTSLMILTGLLENFGYDIIETRDGREALDAIEREAGTLSVIVLDKVMPEMNGLEVVHALKENPAAQHIPIIMLTGSSKPEEIKEGIDAGVFYYLTKPYEDGIFKSVITSAMREAERRSTLKTEFKKHQTSFKLINNAEFTIQTLEEAEDLACFIANCFPDPGTALPGLAGLLVNAVEHGNLEIGYQTKTELLNNGEWRQEIARRENLPEYKDRKVRVSLVRNDHDIRVTIRDEGQGFAWADYMEIDPGRATDTHGRGIAMANIISFDTLAYNEKGNEATAISQTGSGIQW